MSAKQVGIWIRVSTEHQVREESPEHHEKRARHYAEAKGWQVMEVYRLEAVSGKAVMAHPEAQRMLADLRGGAITGLVFSKLARLARSTKELLEFAEIFRAAGADLISLSENIDTSSPAGRLFFTIISAMAEWEREEIASRVAASVPIRARMGKPLGGQAPFGYSWNGRDFVVNEDEAPVRRLMYELFLEHQRKQTTAKALNVLGYRTRNGSEFTATSVSRLLRDPTAKGERRANYTKSTGENRQWTLKPESEWIIVPCPSIVPAKLWNECNAILDRQERLAKPVGPKAAYLLSGFVKCACGKTMYVYQSSRNYACKGCKTRISVADIDEIYQAYLRDYLGSINHSSVVEQSDRLLRERRALLDAATRERRRIAKRVSELIELRLDGGLSKERYAEAYAPLEERLQQLDAQVPQLEAEIDAYAVQLLSTDAVIAEVQTLYDRWAEMPFEQRRSIVETITTAIEVGREDITITLAYAPPIPQDAKNSSRHLMDSYLPQA